MIEIVSRLKNAWLTLTNYDANQMLNVAHCILVSCARGKNASGVIKITKKDGKEFSYKYTVEEQS